MSDFADLSFDEPVTLKAWEIFCQQRNITFLGDSVYEWHGIQIKFGKTYNTIPLTVATLITFSTAAKEKVHLLGEIAWYAWVDLGGNLSASQKVKTAAIRPVMR